MFLLLLVSRQRTSDEEKSIFLAVSRGDAAAVEDLLRMFERVDVTTSMDPNGYTLLHLAVYKDNEKVTKRLCEQVHTSTKAKSKRNFNVFLTLGALRAEAL